MKNLSMIYRLGEIWYYPTIKNKYFRFKRIKNSYCNSYYELLSR